MAGVGAELAAGARVLIVVPTLREARALAGASGAFGTGAHRVGPWEMIIGVRGWAEVCVSGVGKANAAGACASVLDPARHGLVLTAGIAGALPGSGLEPGRLVAGSSSVYGDEGVQTPGGFVGCAALGFPLGPDGDGFACDGRALGLVEAGVDAVGAIATVSTCSGTDDLARAVEGRTGALAEAMEGAAVAQVAWRRGVGHLEVRAISNRTGDRERQGWDMERALGALEALGRLLWGEVR